MYHTIEMGTLTGTWLVDCPNIDLAPDSFVSEFREAGKELQVLSEQLTSKGT